MDIFSPQNITWATSWQNQQHGLCAQQSLRSAWASTQFFMRTAKILISWSEVLHGHFVRFAVRQLTSWYSALNPEYEIWDATFNIWHGVVLRGKGTWPIKLLTFLYRKNTAAAADYFSHQNVALFCIVKFRKCHNHTSQPTNEKETIFILITTGSRPFESFSLQWPERPMFNTLASDLQLPLNYEYENKAIEKSCK